jgi:hypothetical protein
MGQEATAMSENGRLGKFCPGISLASAYPPALTAICWATSSRGQALA